MSIFYKLLKKGEKYLTKPSKWKLLTEFEKLWGLLEEINNGSRANLATRRKSKNTTE